MTKVRKMLNKSNATIPVELEDGNSVYVHPRGVLENENVRNLDKVRRFFQVTEDLTEVGSTKSEATSSPKKQNLNEVIPPTKKVTKKKKA